MRRSTLAAERARRHLTQGDVARAMGVATSTYSHWESGRSNPSFDHSMKLASFFGADSMVLLARDGIDEASNMAGGQHYGIR